MQQPRAGAAARDAGATGRDAGAGAPAAGATPSGTPAASGCAAFVGGVVRPAARRVRVVVPHTGAGRQAACNMHVRVAAAACMRTLLARNCALLHAVRARARPHAQPLCMRVRRGQSPGTGVGEAHTRLADAVVVDMRGPSRMALPVRVPAAELRACVQGSCSVRGHVF
jgi:hypothetical protein